MTDISHRDYHAILLYIGKILNVIKDTFIDLFYELLDLYLFIIDLYIYSFPSIRVSITLPLSSKPMELRADNM